MNMESFIHYTFGIPYIDEEHRCIFELMNKINTHSRNGKKEQALVVLMELCAFLSGHLESEEAMMEEIKFPYLAYHKKEHQRINKELTNLREGFDSFHYWDVTNILSNLMIKHIDEVDSQYVVYYKKWLSEQKTGKE